MLTVGSEAPDFVLESHRGGTVRLQNLRGSKRALLVFYPKDDTPGCTAQLCAIRDDFSVLAEADVVPFGINADGVAEHRAFASSQNYQFDLLVDADGETSRAYGADRPDNPMPQRTVYIVGRDGTILFAERGAPSPATMLAAIREANDSADGSVG
ncbi:MAG TPA: peroxiredoxin [Thermomicrobiales bacterium]|jgi:peroxiredoxin Q/BCP|nr:peroxiredoxin [Thermomicrobiales bacterium]